MVLLNRPFVSYDHLQSICPSIAPESFSACAAASTDFTCYLAAYEREFSLQKAPFIMSYAAYVSATIHVRIAAQGTPNSAAHGLLKACMRVLDENQATYWASHRANRIVRGLVKRMGVNLEHVSASDVSAGQSTDNTLAGSSTVQPLTTSAVKKGDWLTESAVVNHENAKLSGLEDYDSTMLDVDIDAILRSFMTDGGSYSPQSLFPTDVTATNSVSLPSTATERSWDGLEPAQGACGAMPLPADTADSEGFYFNDPIFGFSSSALDEFDLRAPNCNAPN